MRDSSLVEDAPAGSRVLLQQFAWIIGLALGISLIALSGGASWVEAGAILVAVTIQVVFGAGVWLMVTRTRTVSVMELLAVGVTLGPALVAVTALLAITQGIGLSRLIVWSSLSVLGASGVIALIHARRLRRTVTFPEKSEVAVLIIAGIAAYIATRGIWAEVNLPREIYGWGTIGGDAGVEEARVNSLMIFGLNDYLLADGQPLKYHFLGHVWSGAMNVATRSEPFVVTTRVVPPLTFIGTGLLTWTWVKALSSKKTPALLATLFLLTAGIAGSFLGAIFLPSFSQSWGVAVGALFIVVWWWGVQGNLKCWWLILGVIGFALALAKVNGVLLVAAAALSSVLMLARRSGRAWSPVIASLIALGLAAVAVFVYEYGYGNGLILTASQTAQYLRVSSIAGIELPFLLPQILATAFLLTPWIAGVNLVASESPLRPQIVTFGSSLALLALGSTVFLGQSGQSQLYFSMIAGVAMIPLAAWGAFVAWNWMGTRRDAQAIALLTTLGIAIFWDFAPVSDGAVKLLASLSIAVVAGLGISLLWLGGHKRVMRSFGLAAAFVTVAMFVAITMSWLRVSSELVTQSTYSPESPNGLSVDHVEAIRWLQRQNQDRELVATNFVCSDPSQVPPDCLAITFPLAAIGSQPTLLEGFSYSAGMQAPGWAVQRLELVESLVRQGSQTAGIELADLGVRWVFVDKRRTSQRNWEPVGEVVFQNDFAIVLRLESND